MPQTGPPIGVYRIEAAEAIGAVVRRQSEVSEVVLEIVRTGGDYINTVEWLVGMLIPPE